MKRVVVLETEIRDFAVSGVPAEMCVGSILAASASCVSLPVISIIIKC